MNMPRQADVRKGNYILDSLGRRFYFRLRQGGVLICFIAFIAICGGAKVSAFPYPLNAKISVANLFEDILIANPAVEIDNRVACFNLVYFARSEDSVPVFIGVADFPEKPFFMVDHDFGAFGVSESCEIVRRTITSLSSWLSSLTSLLSSLS